MGDGVGIGAGDSPWVDTEELTRLAEQMTRSAVRCTAVTELIVDAAASDGTVSSSTTEMVQRGAHAALLARAKCVVAESYLARCLWVQAADHAAAALEILDEARKAATRDASRKRGKRASSVSGSSSAAAPPVPAELVDEVDTSVAWEAAAVAPPTPLDKLFTAYCRARNAGEVDGREDTGAPDGSAGRMRLATAGELLDAVVSATAPVHDGETGPALPTEPAARAAAVAASAPLPFAWEAALRGALQTGVDVAGEGRDRAVAGGDAGGVAWRHETVSWIDVVSIVRGAWLLETLHAHICEAMAPELLAACLRVFRGHDALQVGFAPAARVVAAIRADVELAEWVDVRAVVQDMEARAKQLAGKDFESPDAGDDDEDDETTGAAPQGGSDTERQPYFSWEEVACIVARHQPPPKAYRQLLRGRLLTVLGSAHVRLAQLRPARYALESALVHYEAAAALETFAVHMLFQGLSLLAGTEEAAVPKRIEAAIQSEAAEWVRGPEGQSRADELCGLDPETRYRLRAEARITSMHAAASPTPKHKFLTMAEARDKLFKEKVLELRAREADEQAREIATWRDVRVEWLVKAWELCDATFGSGHLVTAAAFAEVAKLQSDSSDVAKLREAAGHFREAVHIAQSYRDAASLEAYLQAELAGVLLKTSKIIVNAAREREARRRERGGSESDDGADAAEAEADALEALVEAVPLLESAAGYHVNAVLSGEVDTLWGVGRARAREASVLLVTASDVSVAAGDLETSRRLLERAAPVEAELYVGIGASVRAAKAWARVANAHLQAAEDAVASQSRLGEARRHADRAVSGFEVSEAVLHRRYGATSDKTKLVRRRLAEARKLAASTKPLTAISHGGAHSHPPPRHSTAAGRGGKSDAQPEELDTAASGNAVPEVVAKDDESRSVASEGRGERGDGTPFEPTGDEDWLM